MKPIYILAACGLVFALQGRCRPAQAADKRPVVGMIADVKGGVRWTSARRGKPDMLDELHEGDSLNAPKGARLVLVYYEGCRKETITGPASAEVRRTASFVADPDSVQVTVTKCERRKAVLPAGAGRSAQALVVARADTGGYDRGEAVSESSLGGGGGPALAAAPMGLAASSARGKRQTSQKASAPALAMADSAELAPAEGKAAEAEMAGPPDDGARREYLNAIKRSPNDISARLAYAAYLENEDRLTEALAQYQAVLKKRPRSAAVRKRCEELQKRINKAGR